MCAMNKNEVKITILDDGSVKVETGAFDGAKHTAAEAWMCDLAAAFGTTTRTRKPHSHVHEHEHDHNHETEGNKS